MAKKKESPYRLGTPKTDSPMKEMSWCLNNRIKVNIDPEAVKEGLLNRRTQGLVTSSGQMDCSLSWWLQAQH